MKESIEAKDAQGEIINVEDVNKENESQTETPGYSRWALYRGTKKARMSLPETPEKRVAIVEKLIESPTTERDNHVK